MDDGKRFYERPVFWPRLIGAIFVLVFGIAFRSEIFILLRFILAIIQLLLLHNTPSLASGTPKALLVLLANLFIFAVCYFVLLGWISLFVLPSKNPDEKKHVFQRLVDYVFGVHGPAVFVRDGELIARKGENIDEDGVKARFVSLAFVDMASAIITESGSIPPLINLPKKPDASGDHPSPVRALGPGIAFLRSGERIRGSVDLRPQFRKVSKVRGFTSDGIELITNVNVTFTLGESPDVMTVIGNKKHDLRRMSVDQTTRIISFSDNIDAADVEEIHERIQDQKLARTNALAAEQPSSKRPPYKIDEDRIIAAVISQPRNTKDGKLEKWTDLPVRVATSMLLDDLSQVSYDELYSLDSPEPDCFLYDTFKPEFKRKVMEGGVFSCQFVQRKDGKSPQEGDVFKPDDYVFREIMELHNSKQIRDRGIKIIEVGFSDFEPFEEDTIPAQRFDTWRSRWQRKTELIQADYDLETVRQLNHARASAQREIIYNLSQIFRLPGFTQEAMAIRIFQALESAAANPATNRLLPRDTVDMLKSFQNILFPQGRSGTTGQIPMANDETPSGDRGNRNG